MMSLKIFSLLFLGWCAIILKTCNAADILVQLNVNRPLNDVNEKFVNFAIKPEELYRALDGDNRRIITRMAALLGESYIKFTNDYDFAMNNELKLRNPTKIIWKGFNRWARAVNWTMVIPLPYDPNSWDPMETLRILNSSYLAGINECVWQLGTDFGESHAEDYVADLTTLNMMVQSFKSYVDNWRIMGADISAGSSAEETKRYIEMSKDLNSAFGWTHQSNNALAALPNDEPAMRVLLRQKVPVWITLPQKPKLKASQMAGNVIGYDEATEALNWAKMLGEAASTGYDAIFRRITASDLERPNFSYYVSALFKKVMGSRVFPARPLNAVARANKIYTHCANTVSGGIAFMIANANEQSLQMKIHSLSKVAATEVWQYTLTMKKAATLLNGDRLWYNSTLRPEKTHKQPNRSIQLSTPPRSVSFWVLPNMNIDHCQYTEIAEDETGTDSSEEQKIVKRYSSADKLLLQLIQESSVANNPLVRAMNRRRRYATTKNAGRSKRFVLKEKRSTPKGWGTIFKPLPDLRSDDIALEPKLSAVTKREHASKPEVPLNPLNWFTNLMENTMTGELPPLLRRGIRSVDDDYFGPLFGPKDGKKSTTFTKKITEIKKPEPETKPLFEMEEFDEEEFFKKLENYREPPYPRLPEGDVLLQLITNSDGEEIDELAEERTKTNGKARSAEQSQEIVNEMKPLKLLPTELYESLPTTPLKPAANRFSDSYGDALNKLLFPDPFAKKPSKTKKALNIEKEYKPSAKSTSAQVSQLARDFIRTQKELRSLFGQDDNKSTENNNERRDDKSLENNEISTIEPTTEKATDKSNSHENKSEVIQSAKDYRFPGDPSPDQMENFFAENDDSNNGGQSKQKFDELPWWDLDLLKKKRKPRSLYFNLLDDDDLHTNLISKDEELIPLGARIPPEQLVTDEKHIWDKFNRKPEVEEQTVAPEKKPKEHKFVATFKEKLTNLVDVVARQVTDWYETFKRHIDSSGSSAKKMDNSTNTLENKVK